MKKLLIISLTVLLTVTVSVSQHFRRKQLLSENEFAASTLAELQTRLASAAAAKQTAEQHADELRSRLEMRSPYL